MKKGEEEVGIGRGCVGCSKLGEMRLLSLNRRGQFASRVGFLCQLSIIDHWLW